MLFISTIGEAFHTVNRNWQLVLIQLLFMMFSFVSFFVVVGIPIAVAFILFGLDLTEILRLHDIVSAFKGSAELLQKYFGIALLILLSILAYLTFIIIVWVFTIGGTVGALVRTVADRHSRFSFSAFLSEGKRLFFRILLFSTVIAAVFVTLALVLGVIGSGASAIIETAKAHEATLALFLGIFFSLVLLSVGVFLILLTLSITVYGIAHLAFENSRPAAALKGTLRYLSQMPSAVGFYAVLLFGYMLIGLLVILIGSPLAFIPGAGSLLSLPYQFFIYVLQCYASLVMLAASFHYYYSTRPLPPVLESIPGPDTSQETTGEQAPAPENPKQPPQE